MRLGSDAGFHDFGAVDKAKSSRQSALERTKWDDRSQPPL
jgi:hypothetical protein